MKNHILKTEKEYFQEHLKGVKNFEVRLNDRDFQVGDQVCLQEVEGGVGTGRMGKVCKIVYILRGGQFGLNHEYVVFSMVET